MVRTVQWTEPIFDRCDTAEDVIELLRESAAHRVGLLGIWRVPLEVRRGARIPYEACTYTPRDVPPEFKEQYWAQFREHGPSFFARYAWQTRRDVTVSEAIGAMKPEPSELWFPELAARYGKYDALLIPTIGWWMAYFWSGKLRQFDRNTRKVLRNWAYAGVSRLLEVTCHRDEDEKEHGQPLSPLERDILDRLLPGPTEKEVARQLGVSVSTVKTCVARSQRKLGTKGLRDTLAEARARYIVPILVAATVACATMSEVVDFDGVMPGQDGMATWSIPFDMAT